MKLTGVGASDGVAVGPAFVPTTGTTEPDRTRIAEGEVETELQRFEDAVEAVAGELHKIVDRLRDSGNESLIRDTRNSCPTGS